MSNIRNDISLSCLENYFTETPTLKLFKLITCYIKEQLLLLYSYELSTSFYIQSLTGASHQSKLINRLKHFE